jgi:hypothetical protein
MMSIDKIGGPELCRESFKLKPTVQTYELLLADLVKLFAQQLGVPEKRISITKRDEFQHSDASGGGHYVFNGIIVSVKGD